MRKIKNKKIVVAMSGGVDSSVAAALLKRAGLDVVGVFMKFWKAPDDNGLIGGWNRCCSPEAESRARKVAKILKIPFYVFNFEKEFKKRIVDYFLKEHRAGLTPNPCVICNKEIKFGLLLEKALAMDADFVATGHYARLGQEILNPKSEIRNYRYKLLKGKDKNKDQSYFLWLLNQNQLKRILFPVGNYTRKEVEGLAKKLKLPVLGAKKSVEICFIRTTINDFLKKYLKEKPGKIINTKGKIIGEHQGLWFYTIGQRKGIKLFGGPAFANSASVAETTSAKEAATAGKPYYVLDKNFKKNILIVTKNEKDLYKKELTCKNVNWISGKVPKLPLKIKVKIRYRHLASLAIIYKILNTKYYIRFNKLQRAITPGQSVVFYRGHELLGGGMIC